MQAGWMQDPTGRHQLRYHDGARWTEHVSDNGATSTDPVEVPPVPMPPPGAAPTLPPTTSMRVSTPVQPAQPVTPFGAVTAGAARGKKPLWKRWWFVGGVGIVVLAIVGGALAGSDEDTDGTASDDDRVVSDEPDADQPSDDDPADPAEPDNGIPDAEDGPFPVGTAVMEDDDLVRVNAINTNVPGNEFFEPDPGTTVTTAEVEACGGNDGFNANALYWTAFLDDNTAAENYLFADDFQTIGLRPGACTRGLVSFEVPDGKTVASIVLTGPLFDETARWTVAGAVPVTEPLQPVEAMETTPLGSTAEFGAGHTAVVRSVVDGAPPLNEFFGPGAGRQFNQIDVELCAGSEPLPVNPLYWLGSGTDSWMGSAGLGGSTLQTIELAPGQCVAGLVELDMPAGSVTASVVLMDPIFDEVGRWSVG